MVIECGRVVVRLVLWGVREYRHAVIYIYIERERERERETSQTGKIEQNTYGSFSVDAKKAQKLPLWSRGVTHCRNQGQCTCKEDHHLGTCDVNAVTECRVSDVGS